MKIYKHWIENGIIRVKGYECDKRESTDTFNWIDGSYSSHVPTEWINKYLYGEIYTLTPNLNKEAFDDMLSKLNDRRVTLSKEMEDINDTHSLWSEAFLFKKYIDEDCGE